MCLVAPARVIALEGPGVVVDLDGRRRHASLLLTPEVQVGDWVIVGSGTVLRRLDPGEAADLNDILASARSTGGAAPTGGPR
ncbi:MAG TPA: HypC/HybG/HupF family hydrogenase formation chaperone [Candidatus Limnocylindrales bacterium]